MTDVTFIRRLLPGVFWGAAFLSVVAAMYYMFLAGCAGDVKGGWLGNRQLAIDREDTAVLLGFIAVILGLIAIGAQQGLSLGQRLGAWFGFSVCSLAGLVISGLQLEVWGVQACF